jgi:predicted O-methyltransferase YrrM
VTADAKAAVQQVRAVRTQLQTAGPSRTRPLDNDFERVALPADDCDFLRDELIAEGARVVIEVGLAYGSSALAIGEALCVIGTADRLHIVIDPFQATAFQNTGWDALVAAGLADYTRLVDEPSSQALARLAADGFMADAAFVDGSHRFHEVFVDLYFLRKLIRPRGLVILDDVSFPSVAGALRYFDLNLGWRPVEMPGRLTARRLPDEPVEPAFTDFVPFLETSLPSRT